RSLERGEEPASRYDRQVEVLTHRDFELLADPGGMDDARELGFHSWLAAQGVSAPAPGAEPGLARADTPRLAPGGPAAAGGAAAPPGTGTVGTAPEPHWAPRMLGGGAAAAGRGRGACRAACAGRAGRGVGQARPCAPPAVPGTRGHLGAMGRGTPPRVRRADDRVGRAGSRRAGGTPGALPGVAGPDQLRPCTGARGRHRVRGARGR